MRTYIATNYVVDSALRAEGEQHNETWGSYPDDQPLHSLALHGDSRAALAPFLAHRRACSPGLSVQAPLHSSTQG